MDARRGEFHGAIAISDFYDDPFVWVSASYREKIHVFTFRYIYYSLIKTDISCGLERLHSLPRRSGHASVLGSSSYIYLLFL